MVRNILGALLALAGAAAAVRSPFRVWYDGRHGSDIRVDDLFTHVGVTPHDAALLGSLFLPMAFAALLTLLGVLARSRFAVALAGVLVLGVTVLWMVRQAQYSRGSLTAGGNGLGQGFGLAFLGGLLLLAAALLPPQRRRPRLTEPDRRYGDPPPPDRPPYEPRPYEPSAHEPSSYDAKPYDDTAPYEQLPYDPAPYALPSGPPPSEPPYPPGPVSQPVPEALPEPPDAPPPPTWQPPAR